MNQRVELGSFYLSHPAQDGPARVSTALFLRSANGESITIQASDDLLQLLSSGEVWVARGSICSVDIHLRGLLGPGEILHLKTYDNVCKAIEEAEFWRRLDLRAGIKQRHRRSDEELNLSFTLHHEQPEPPRRPRPHLLRIDDSYADLRPPDGVPALLPERLEIDVDFAFDVLQKDSESPEGANLLLVNEVVSGLQHYTEDDDELLLEDLCGSNTSYRERAPRANYDHRELEDEGLLQSDTIARSTSRVIDRESRSSFLVAILDAAIRTSIQHTPKRLQEGIKVERDDRSTVLQDIAPAPWVPDYLRAMTERACLLPTLSRAFATSLPSRHTSTSLSKKLDQIHLLSQQNLLLEARYQNPEEITTTPSKFAAMSAHTWKALDRQMRLAHNSQKLPPLAEPPNVTEAVEKTNDAQQSMEALGTDRQSTHTQETNAPDLPSFPTAEVGDFFKDTSDQDLLLHWPIEGSTLPDDNSLPDDMINSEEEDMLSVVDAESLFHELLDSGPSTQTSWSSGMACGASSPILTCPEEAEQTPACGTGQLTLDFPDSDDDEMLHG